MERWPSAQKAGWLGGYINVQRCGGLSKVPLQLKDPLELFVKRKEFLPSSVFLFHRNNTEAVESNAKNHSFLPFAQSRCRMLVYRQKGGMTYVGV